MVNPAGICCTRIIGASKLSGKKGTTLCNALGPPVEHANAISLFFPVAFKRLIGAACADTETLLISYALLDVLSIKGLLTTVFSRSCSFETTYLLVFRTADKTESNLSLNSSPFASIMLFGLVTKSIAPRSNAKMVTSASLVVRVLTIIILALMLSCCNFSSNCRPSILGIFTSKTTPSYWVVFNFSYASSPSLHTSIASKLLSELIISHITLLISAESSTTRMFFFINSPYFFPANTTFLFKYVSHNSFPIFYVFKNKLCTVSIFILHMFNYIT